MPPTDDQDRLLDHSYDGIQEYDNPLPRWWVWIFWATMAYALVYVVDVTGRVKGPGRIREYEQQLADAAKRWPQTPRTFDAAALAAMITDARVVADGQTVYTTSCAACHRADAGGLIGPNLTDEYWLHGGSPSEILATIANGVLDKGMPPWGKVLTPEQSGAVTAYIVTLKGTNPADPKPPQGVKPDPILTP